MIKSLDELRKIKEEHSSKVALRRNKESTGNQMEIMVGMSTCGISSGARETLNAFMNELEKEKINNVKVISVGCIGYCHSEPTVQVNIPGKKPILYGNVKADKVHEIIINHIQGGEPVKSMILETNFERA